MIYQMVMTSSYTFNKITHINTDRERDRSMHTDLSGIGVGEEIHEKVNSS